MTDVYRHCTWSPMPFCEHKLALHVLYLSRYLAPTLHHIRVVVVVVVVVVVIVVMVVVVVVVVMVVVVVVSGSGSCDRGDDRSRVISRSNHKTPLRACYWCGCRCWWLCCHGRLPVYLVMPSCHCVFFKYTILLRKHCHVCVISQNTVSWMT